jgi:hypothetical protein
VGQVRQVEGMRRLGGMGMIGK